MQQSIHKSFCFQNYGNFEFLKKLHFQNQSHLKACTISNGALENKPISFISILNFLQLIIQLYTVVQLALVYCEKMPLNLRVTFSTVHNCTWCANVNWLEGWIVSSPAKNSVYYRLWLFALNNQVRILIVNISHKDAELWRRDCSPHTLC